MWNSDRVGVDRVWCVCLMIRISSRREFGDEIRCPGFTVWIGLNKLPNNMFKTLLLSVRFFNYMALLIRKY